MSHDAVIELSAVLVVHTRCCIHLLLFIEYLATCYRLRYAFAHCRQGLVYIDPAAIAPYHNRIIGQRLYGQPMQASYRSA